MKLLRLDKLLSDMGYGTRSEISKSLRSGACSVDGKVICDGGFKVNPETAVVLYYDEAVEWREHVYIMLNKPAGVVSATEDNFQRTVMSLVDERFSRMGVFPCGRLDIDTVGLLILTNDGEAAHRRLSPKHHVEKVYRFKCEKPLGDAEISKFAEGLTLNDGTAVRPAKLSVDAEGLLGEVTLTEGMFHEVKRMFEAVGNKITFLERIAFGGICLDPDLQRGQWRFLTPEEEKLFTAK